MNLPVTHRWDVIQLIIDKINAQSYLEIGFREDANFKNITCPLKESVDIEECGATYTMSSDEFFEQNTQLFDVIFIDGDHTKEQVLKDIENSLNHLSDKGVILTHDTCPNESFLIEPEYCYNAWEAFDYLRRTNPNLYMSSIIPIEDHSGIGIIKRGSQQIYTGNPSTEWKIYYQDRSNRMNIITTDQLLTQI